MKKNQHWYCSRPRTSVRAHPATGRRGFSLLELLIVLLVTMILTSLLLPAMNKLRENVHRVMCSSNQRQIGAAVIGYVTDHNDTLPDSALLVDPESGPWEPQELMAAYQGSRVGWDGLGLLFEQGYCTSYQCFYCPSHTGDHHVDRYAQAWESPTRRPIYMNVHYAGHREWSGQGMPRLWRNPSRMVLTTDGLRTAADFNHQSGTNVLYGDGSVRWSGAGLAIMQLLPDDTIEGNSQSQTYTTIWNTIQAPDIWSQ